VEKIRYLHRAPEPDPKVMSFVEHLEELRRRLIVMSISVVVLSIVGWFLFKWELHTIATPLTNALKGHPYHHLIYTNLYGAFTLQLKLAIVTGIVLSIPVIVHQTWGFVVPALPRGMYRFGPYVMTAGVLLFAAGAFTGYEVMPLAINFFVSRGGSDLSYLPDAVSYIGFVGLIVAIFGVAFEMPLALVLLCLAGITNSGWLWRKRVYAFFIIFAVSTLITPGADWISPLVLGGILFVLYLSSIVVAKLLRH
jgi:sec-independent protein translocase protein TatC